MLTTSAGSHMAYFTGFCRPNSPRSDPHAIDMVIPDFRFEAAISTRRPSTLGRDPAGCQLAREVGCDLDRLIGLNHEFAGPLCQARLGDGHRVGAWSQGRSDGGNSHR